MKKRFLSLILAIALVFSVSNSGFALSTYAVPDGTVVLESVPLDYEVLVIPDSVQVINDAPYMDHNGMLRYVSIGSNVQYIGENSFSGASISAVTIPASVTHIGYNAFPRVETVTFEAGSAISLFNYDENGYPIFTLYTAFPNARTVHIKTTPDKVDLSLIKDGDVQKVTFSDGTVWERGDVYFPTGIKEIPSNFFSGSTARVEIPDSVQMIESYAFENARFGEFVLGNGVCYIGDNLFGSYYNPGPENDMFTSVTIPSSVSYIGANAFPSVYEVTFEAGSAVMLFNRNDYGDPAFNFASAFPYIDTVHINTTPDKVDIDLIFTGTVRYIFFADGTVLDRDTPYFPEGIKEIPQNFYSGYTSNMKIPDTVQIIDSGAFNNARIGNFVLGNNVVEIGSNLFGNDTSYTESLEMFSSVTIPSSVESIGDNAFPNVKTVTFEVGSAITLLGTDNYSFSFSSAFPNAKTVYIRTTADKINLSGIIQGTVERVYFSDGSMWDMDTPYFRDTMTVIPSHYFSGHVSELKLPDSVTFIEDYAFNNAHIGNLVLGENVEYIGGYLFGDVGDCGLRSVRIPSSVKEIGYNAFPGVQTVTFEAGSAATLFDSYTGEGSFNIEAAFPDATTVYIKTTPNNVDINKLMGRNIITIVFADGSIWKRGELFFSNGQSAILEGQYDNYSYINKINIPDSIVTIEKNAFKNLEYGTEAIPLTLGKNVSYIGTEAFCGSSVGSIVFGSAPVVIEENAFANTMITSLNIPANVISLGNNAFNTESLKAVTIDASLLTGALEGKRFVDVFGTSVTTVVIKGDITEIPAGIFEDSGVKTVSFSDKVVVVNDNAFKNAPIKEARIGDDVIRIGSYAYSGTDITSINVPENVEYIGKSAFANNAKLKNAIINGSISMLPNGIFSGCSALENVKLSDGISAIGDYAFSSCSALTSIEIPKGVTEIGAYAFAICKSLKEVVIPEGVTIIRAGTFKNCTALENVVIPKSVTTIEEGAFEGCTKLGDIVIPESISEIQNAAFMNCANLSSVVVPENVTVVGADAFAGCDNLILGGCENTAVEVYAEENGIEFCCVNAIPCIGTSLDLSNQVVYTKQGMQNDPCELIKPATDTEIVCSDKYCGTGSTVTITRDGVKQEYTVVVDGDLTGDSVCDVLDATMVQRYSSGMGDEPSDLDFYAVGGKTNDEITVDDYSAIVNKVLREE